MSRVTTVVERGAASSKCCAAAVGARFSDNGKGGMEEGVIRLSSWSWRLTPGMWETVCMAEKRTKADKAQREADLLDKKSCHRPPQNQRKRPREDFNQAAMRIVEEAAEKH